MFSFGRPVYVPPVNLLASLAALAASNAVKEGTRGASEKILEESRSLAPRLTGALASSGHVEEIEGGSGFEVVYDVSYAVYVEFGTSDTPTFAFLRRGVEAAGYDL